MRDQTAASVQLPALLESQAELLEGLIAVGHEQLEAIEQGRMNELLSVFARKQDLLDRLTANARWLRPLHSRLQSDSTLTEAQRCEYRQQHARATARSEQLFALEKTCEQLLLESREREAQRPQRAVHFSAVAAAYRRQPVDSGQRHRLDLCSSS